MDFELNSREQALVDLVRDFAQGEVARVAPQAWAERRCPVELLRTMGEIGLLGMLVPEELGGIGMSTVGFVAAMDELGSVDQSVAAAWQAHCTIGTLPLLAFGTPKQQARWLRPIAEGRTLSAFGLTEAEAGSDAAGVRTSAVRDGDGWRIDGRKMFISNAGTEISGGVVVLARVVEGSKAVGYGNFIVPTGTAGYVMGQRLRGIGWRSLDTRELIFDDVRLPGDHLIGDTTLGLRQFLSVLEMGRISIAALATSLIRGVLDLALSHASQRVQFGAPIGDYQAIKFKLADMATEYEACRWLTYRAAYLRDSGRQYTQAAAMAKLQASQSAMRAASEAVQIYGGSGFMEETAVGRFFCDAKVLEIGEGTNEIQRLVIARSLQRSR